MKRLSACLVITVLIASVASAKEYYPDDGKFGGRLAVGVAVDVLPVALSAAAGEIGWSAQAWFGVDNVRVRMIGAKLHQPDFLIGEDGFEHLSTTAIAAMIDYTFGDYFDGWRVGGGIEIWANRIEHEDVSGGATWTSPVATVGGGYVWKFWRGMYLEPSAAVHFVLQRPTVTLAGESYDPPAVVGEISLKLGTIFDF